MAKWKLFFTTLPYVGIILALKILLARVFGFEGFLELGEVSLVLTGGIFLIGFMLAGTMADYKESEKIPGDLAAALETAEDTIMQVSINAKDPSKIDTKAVLKELFNLGESIIDWFYKKKSDEEMYASLTSIVNTISELEKLGANGGGCGKIIGDFNNIRKIINRVGVISRTGFLATGYALLEGLIAAIIIILLIVKFKSIIAEAIIVSFIGLIYIYMYRLIKDIDDPFEYDEEETGVTEIPLFPITEYLDRLKKKIS
ncbi:MAG: hypothetical protein QXO70_02830 [Candidatus Pacearchaeota archaeon]